jgi:hypothetical protein
MLWSAYGCIAIFVIVEQKYREIKVGICWINDYMCLIRVLQMF